MMEALSAENFHHVLGEFAVHGETHLLGPVEFPGPLHRWVILHPRLTTLVRYFALPEQRHGRHLLVI
jgi:hypothetical protein